MPAPLSRLFLVAATCLAAGRATAVDVVIFDRGGGTGRVEALARALGAAGHSVIGPDDTAALDVAYAATCTDGPCHARAGVAGGVALVVLAEPAHVVVVDVASTVLRRRGATADQLGVVTLKLLEPGRWGTLDRSGLPPDAVVTVDGAPWTDEDLAPGRHRVTVSSSAGRHDVDVDVVAGAGVPLLLPAPQAVDTAGPRVGTIVGLTGLGVGLAGLATGLVGEAMFSSVPLDPVPDANAARTLIVGEQVATVGWGVLVGGAVVALVGLGFVVADR